MSASDLRVEDKAGARWVTLARPPLNILDIATVRRLDDTVAATPPDARVLVLRSAIEGCFSAGTDVKDHRRETAPEMLAVFHRLIRLLHDLPQATLAAVDGRCLGGGCELALSCDIVVASARSSFGLPEIGLGCFPPVASVLLPRLAGRAALAMVLGGEPVPAVEAARCGLVTAVVDDVDRASDGWVARLSSRSGAVLALARRAVREGATGPLAEALARVERLYLDELLATEDAAEGVRAFLERRKPDWQHR